MPIDDRIRDGLTRNADVPSPSVERHLDRVLARRRRQVAVRTAAVAAVAVGAVVPWALVQGDGQRVGDPAAPSPALQGTYRVVVGNSDAPADMPGTWTVTLGDNGSIAVKPPAGYHGNGGVGESYELAAPGELTTNLFVGAPGCQRGDPPVGVYGFAATAAGVQFTRVEDGCPARVAIFAGHWERLR